MIATSPTSGLAYALTPASVNPLERARTDLDRALRCRRNALANYGRAIAQADYTIPAELRDAQLAELRQVVADARAEVEAALDRLEGLL